MLGEELNLFLSIGGFVVGILGLISGVVFYLKGKSKKILEYQVKSHDIICPYDSQKMPELKILFNEKSISTLTSTTITFTNSGNQTITSNDFAKYGKLVIKVSKCFLGNESKIRIDKDNKNSAASITFLEENLMEVYFDFLKEKEPFKVSFYHDGNIDILGELKSGTIRERMEIGKLILTILSVIFFIGFIIYQLCAYHAHLVPVEGDPFEVAAFIAFVFVIGMIYPYVHFILWQLGKIFSLFLKLCG